MALGKASMMKDLPSSSMTQTRFERCIGSLRMRMEAVRSERAASPPPWVSHPKNLLRGDASSLRSAT